MKLHLAVCRETAWQSAGRDRLGAVCVCSVSQCFGCCLVSPGLETQRLPDRHVLFVFINLICLWLRYPVDSAHCYRTFPCWFGLEASRFVSASLKVFSHGNLRRRSLQGPRSTTTGDTLKHAQCRVLSFILSVNCNGFYKTEAWFCLTYSNNQMENLKVNMSDDGTWRKHLTVLLILDFAVYWI